MGLTEGQAPIPGHRARWSHAAENEGADPLTRPPVAAVPISGRTCPLRYCLLALGRSPLSYVWLRPAAFKHLHCAHDSFLSCLPPSPQSGRRKVSSRSWEQRTANFWATASSPGLQTSILPAPPQRDSPGCPLAPDPTHPAPGQPPADPQCCTDGSALLMEACVSQAQNPKGTCEMLPE